MDLVEQIRKKAIAKPAKILICEGWDERCLRATETVLKEGYCQIALLGDPAKIAAAAEDFGVDTSQAEIVDHTDDALRKELAEKLVEVRKHKGMDLETATKLIDDVNYFGCMLAHTGRVDGVAGSAICPTAELMRPALQILRKPGIVVSELFVLTDPDKDRTFIFSDGSLNIDPTPEQVAQIAENAVLTAKRFDIEPRVAFLSFSSKGSGGENDPVLHVREAYHIFKKNNPDVICDGELQMDAAVNPKAASRKCPDSPLKGNANVLITPNLTVGNIVVHTLMQFSNLRSDFILVEGMAQPVSIIGRSTTVDIVENAIVSCAMQTNS